MIIYFVTFLSFILFLYKYSLPNKQLPPWSNEVRLLSFHFWEDLSTMFPPAKSIKSTHSVYFTSKMPFKTKRKCYRKLNTCTMGKIETIAATEPSWLDLTDLALETVLEKLDPVDLCKMACVSTYLRDMCLSDHLWKQHMDRKWGGIVGSAAHKEWLSHVASQKDVIDRAERSSFLTKLGHVMMLKLNEERKRTQPLDTCSTVSCYKALETGKFWFPAQVFNRENGHVGFVMSCYDAELCYDSHTDTFEARYPPHGPRTVAEEIGATWDRLREAPDGNLFLDLHSSTCLNDLRPKDHIEIQWRRHKQFPYDTVVLEFMQYAPGSRWRHMKINRKDHREEGNETDGFYGGIKKLYNKDEISMWLRFWPTDTLE